jgi:hypothetical protein
VLKRWDIETKQDRDNEDNVATRTPPLPLEEHLSWHSGVAFQPAHPEWRPIYEAERGAVVVERNFGHGSVVLASDSFFASNEAMLADRAPRFLAWLTGANRRVVFDESHLNVREDPSIATLLRRYGLSGFVIGLVALIALWLWRNATYSLVPPRPSVRADEVVSGRDSFSGLVHLLRRGIAPAQLLEVCRSEWKKSAGAAAQAKLGEPNPDDDADPVAAYNQMSARLSSKKWKTTPVS